MHSVWTRHYRVTAEELPEERDRELKMSTQPPNYPHPSLVEHKWCASNVLVHGCHVIAIRGFTLSETMFGSTLRVKAHPFKCQDPLEFKVSH